MILVIVGTHRAFTFRITTSSVKMQKIVVQLVYIKASTHMQTKQFAISSHWVCNELIFHKPEANTGHMAHPVPLVFAQQTNKFRFATNSMRTIRRRCGACLQSHPRIHTFDFHVCTRLLDNTPPTLGEYLKLWTNDIPQVE